MTYRLKYRDRDGIVSVLAGSYKTREAANVRVHSIGAAQRQNGATHVTQFSGLARASWPDGSYIEVWRAAS